MRTRNNEIHFFLNDREQTALQRRLAETGLSCSAYMRQLITEHIPPSAASASPMAPLFTTGISPLRLAKLRRNWRMRSG